MSANTIEKGRLLVVDDEESIGCLFLNWFVGEGYRVRYAENFEQLQQALREEEFDLVTLDVMMPRVDGLDALKWLDGEYPNVGVIMVTGLSDLDTVLKAMRYGALNYLLKPFNLELVSQEIRVAMDRQRLAADNRAYQLELERKVEAQTSQLKAAHLQLQHKVRELEGRDRLVQFQMKDPSRADVYTEILQVVTDVLSPVGAAMFAPNPDDGRFAEVASLGEGISGDVGVQRLVNQVAVDQQPRAGVGNQAAVPLSYQNDLLAVLWTSGLEESWREEAGSTLWRLGKEGGLLLGSARVSEDLDTGALQLEELLDIDGAV